MTRYALLAALLIPVSVGAQTPGYASAMDCRWGAP